MHTSDVIYSLLRPSSYGFRDKNIRFTHDLPLSSILRDWTKNVENQYTNKITSYEFL